MSTTIPLKDTQYPVDNTYNTPNLMHPICVPQCAEWELKWVTLKVTNIQNTEEPDEWMVWGGSACR